MDTVLNECGATEIINNVEPQQDIIGDETKAISFDANLTGVTRVCILDIDANYTVETLYNDSSTAVITKKKQPFDSKYPHDADEILKELYPNIIVQTVYLIPDVKRSIATIRRLKHEIDIFVNLYQKSDETTMKITEYMQNQGIAFTGASLSYADPTRIELKRVCRCNGLPTPKFALVTGTHSHNDYDQLSERIGGFPLFVKPEHGYDSIGIDEKSLVCNTAELKERCSKMIDEFGGALVEQYIEGREFTVLVAGIRDNIHVFPPAEYNFLANKTFITHEDKWGVGYTGSHWKLLNEADQEEEQKLIHDLMSLARKLYEAFNCDSYARMDIRQDNKTKHLSILDFNPNCCLFYKHSCSADSIIRASGWSKAKFMEFILKLALERQQQYYLTHPYTIKYSTQIGFAMYASRNLCETDLVYTLENRSLKLVTKQYAQQTLTENQMVSFDANAWPLCDNVYVFGHDDSNQWLPFNHSCDPNVWMDGLKYVARKSIGVGDELTIDYSTITNTPPNFECWCGTPVCRRHIKSHEYKEKWFQHRYGSHVNPYILMLIEIEKIKSHIT